MLARLGVEQNEEVRATILRVLGKLRNTEAIGPLTAELNRADAPAVCVAAAADALSALAAREPFSTETATTLVEPLRTRFAAKDAPREVKRAVLGAMAAIGSPQFRPVFETNLTSDDPELVLQAIQGVTSLGDTEQLDRLVALFGHPDARVRQRALESAGRMGTAAQLSAVAARLDRTVEPTDGPRNAAWQAFSQIAARLPVSNQVTAADRLGKHPALQAEFLQRLEAEMSQGAVEPTELFAVREQLAALYDSLDRNCEALPYWRKCHQRAMEQQDDEVARYLLAVLTDALPCGKVDLVIELLRALPEGNVELRGDTEATVMAYFDGIGGENHPAHVEALADKLRGLPNESFPALKPYIREYYKNLAASRPATRPAHSD
jgi:HEAT repeat protein